MLIGMGVLTAASVNQAEQSRKSASQGRTQQREALDAAEGERGRAEAEAAQNANARLAATQQRRRQQQNLLASGATPAPETSLISSTPVTRSTVAQQGSMMGRGAPGASFYG